MGWYVYRRLFCIGEIYYLHVPSVCSRKCKKRIITIRTKDTETYKTRKKENNGVVSIIKLSNISF